VGTAPHLSRSLLMPSAHDAATRAAPGDSVIGWRLDRAERAVLLRRFPPKYPDAVADHVTLQSKVAADAPLPEETEAEIVGRADDGLGVEALVVRLAGATARPDGSTFHITWSLEEGRRARESNAVIATHGWTPFAEPLPLTLAPARWP